MKVNDFIKKAIEVEKIPTLYVWGKYMNVYEGKYLLCDCSGLIKGILWGYPQNGKYKNNNVLDINADTMITKCSSVTSNFSNIQKGWLVWMKGHIGIYIGEGIVIESSPIWENGIQKTYCRGTNYKNINNLKERTWTKCGKFDIYVDYGTSSNEDAVIYRLNKTVNVYLSAVNAKDNIGAITTYQAGEYYIYKVSNGMINITKNKGNPGGWINSIDNQNISLYYSQYKGTSTKLDYILESIGVSSKYYGNWKNRKPLAEYNGINSYKGTLQQNIKLIELAMNGKLKKL